MKFSAHAQRTTLTHLVLVDVLIAVSRVLLLQSTLEWNAQRLACLWLATFTVISTCRTGVDVIFEAHRHWARVLGRCRLA